MSLHVARPKVLGFISEDVSAWLVAALAFLAGGLLTAVLALSTYGIYQRQLRQRFELLASERATRIEERLLDQTQRLESLRRFFTYSDNVSRYEFDGFARPLLMRSQAYSWLPKVTDGERVSFELRARSEGLTDFSIRQLSAEHHLEAAWHRREYFPVLYTQMQSGMPAPWGMDMSADPVRRATLERAAKLARTVVSPPLTLIAVAPQYARGLLLASPVCDVASGELRGYVTAIISLQQLLADGLPVPGDDNLDIEILDLSTESNHEVLFRSSATRFSSSLYSSHLLHFADRNYELDIRPSAVFIDANRSNAVVGVLVLGTLLSVLLSALLYSLVSQRRRALRLVEQRTWQLRISEQELRGTHSRLRSILDAATQVAIIATDLRGVITTFNAGAELMLGYTSSEVVGRLALIDLHLPEELVAQASAISQGLGRDVPLAQAMLVDATDGGAQQAREWTFVRRDGTYLTVNMLATAVRDEQQHWVGYLAICIDTTESRLIHEALAARDRLLENLSAQVPGGIYQFRMGNDGASRFIYASEGMRDIYEVDLDVLHVDASRVFERIHPDDVNRVVASIRYSAEHLSPWLEEYRVRLPLRGLRWIRGEASPEALAGGDTLWHGYLSDISDLKRVEEELRALSITDSLTGIYNRRYFQERLKTELDRSRRDELSLSLIMLDIDHFKRINDQFGHAVGDHVLRMLCDRIGKRVRRTDVFCRLGGEEFMVLCPGSNREQAYSLAYELWQALRDEPVDGVGTVTASFGIASWRRGEGADALLLRADSGVYAAKQAGRDRVELELG